jgi:hypothetical protein
MDKKDNQPGKHTHPLANEIGQDQKEQVAAAHTEAEKDMDNDADLSAHSPNDDLDEGETARLGEDMGGII